MTDRIFISFQFTTLIVTKINDKANSDTENIR